MLLVSVLLSLILTHTTAQTADRYTDENRPYKFGFNIQGHQHRKEEKDENGIIKGEYGFITADGYYRVTVYATDENGDFKIISMKNYYVGFPPEDPTTTPPPEPRRDQPRRLPQQLTRDTPAQLVQTTATPARSTSTSTNRATLYTEQVTSTPTRQPIQGQFGCSNCFIPTTARSLPKTQNNVQPVDYRTSINEFSPKQPADGVQHVTNQPENPKKASPRNQLQNLQQKPQAETLQNLPPNMLPLKPKVKQDNSEQAARPVTPKTEGKEIVQGPDADVGQRARGRQLGASKKLDADQRKPSQGQSRQTLEEPGGKKNQIDTVQAKNQQEVDLAVQHKTSVAPRNNQGEVKYGLPEGVSEQDIRDLLYRFNYTVGFHGHHEDGYRNGDKDGDFFIVGRNGAERRVVYTANEFGFQPNITYVDLDKSDARVPKEETEKDFGLKGYEFKWFYRK